MKRLAPDHDEARNPKRVKSGSKPQDDANLQVKHRRCPQELVTAFEQGQKLPGPRGHLHGEVYKWTTIAQGLAFIIQVPIESNKKHKEIFAFEVVTSGPGEDVLKALEVRDRDEMQLSLKGAALSPVAKHKPRAPTHRFIYRTGIHFRWKDQEINTFGLPVQAKVDLVDPATAETTNQGPADVSKKKQRQLLKEQKREIASKETKSEIKPSNEAEQASTVKPEPASQKLPPTQPPILPVQLPVPAAVPQEVKETPASSQATKSTIALGLARARGFISLEQTTATEAYVNTVGIVVTASVPCQSTKGARDWYQKLRLVDESNMTAEDVISPKGRQFNVFGKTEQELPCPEVGDVLFLRKVKALKSNQPAVGYQNRYTWALFSGEGFHHHGNDLNGLGPFFMPPADHMPIALAMKEWWAKIVALQEEQLVKYRVVDPNASVQYGVAQREHRLICDVHPDVRPDGYFDCTVKVLNGHLNDNGVYSLYVTDYTKCRENQREEATTWCQKELVECVLKIEMWDEAAQLGPELQGGRYVEMKNARMTLSKGGYFEGKIVQKKITILDPEDTDNPHLQALLKREAEFEATNGVMRTLFDDQELHQPKLDEFFNCVAEILHIETREEEGVIAVYVTDYTRRNDLPPVKEDWAQGLDNMVVKIQLFDGQRRVVFKVGGYFKFHKLRLRPRGGVHGHLGGVQYLIRALNPQNEELEALLKRKHDTRGRPTVAPPKRTRGVSLMSIGSFKGSFPQPFLVLAFVKKFLTQGFEESLEQICNQCNNIVSKKHVRCFACEDDGLTQSEETLVVICKVIIEIYDQEGTGAYVNIPLESLVFDGIDTGKILDDPKAQIECEERLKLLKDASVEHGDGKEPTPFYMTLVAWIDDEGKVAFALDRCTLLNDAPLHTLLKAS